MQEKIPIKVGFFLSNHYHHIIINFKKTTYFIHVNMFDLLSLILLEKVT